MVLFNIFRGLGAVIVLSAFLLAALALAILSRISFEAVSGPRGAARPGTAAH